MEDEKKLERKRKRFAARLKSSKGILCQDSPGPNIVLCNVGQATGLKKETILSILEPLGGIELLKFIAEKGESHSFIVLGNTGDAERFYNTWNGRAITDGPPVYMSYVEDVPNTEVICPDKNPDGLTIIENFISAEEEKEFIEIFDWNDESNLKNRLVKHYGYEFRYGSNDVDLEAPMEEKIPVQCDILWKRLQAHGIEFEIPDQMTVNKYSPGQGIPLHVDRHSPFGNTIMSLSLGSAVLMDWKHHSGTYVPVVVPPRSLLVMQGEARYGWQHGITPRTWDPVVEIRSLPAPARVVTHESAPRGPRLSLTFRRTRRGGCACACAYAALCDRASSTPLDDDVAARIEDLHVHQVYERIAAHFGATRRAAWPAVARFLRAAPRGALVLDLGAGSGRNILTDQPQVVQIACERSGALAAACAARGRGVRGVDALRLDLLRAPLRDRCADRLVCVAVLHHLATPARRKEAVSVIARLLRPGALALITVWAKDQTDSNYLCEGREGNSTVFSTVDGVNLPVHENRTQFQHNDLLVPWKLRASQGEKLTNQTEDTLLRFYHVFEQGELESLCDIPELVVEESFYEEGNWCVVVKKIDV